MRDQDRAPRNVIDECARRGGVMLNEFAQLLRDEARYWSDDTTDGDWWLHMHAIRTMGLMASERAGDMLLAYIQQMDDAADESQQDWHSGHWPALFANKPDALTAPLLDYVELHNHSPLSVDVSGAWLSDEAATQLQTCHDALEQAAQACDGGESGLSGDDFAYIIRAMIGEVQ